MSLLKSTLHIHGKRSGNDVVSVCELTHPNLVFEYIQLSSQFIFQSPYVLVALPNLIAIVQQLQLVLDLRFSPHQSLCLIAHTRVDVRGPYRLLRAWLLCAGTKVLNLPGNIMCCHMVRHLVTSERFAALNTLDPVTLPLVLDHQVVRQVLAPELTAFVVTPLQPELALALMLIKFVECDDLIAAIFFPVALGLELLLHDYLLLFHFLCAFLVR